MTAVMIAAPAGPEDDGGAVVLEHVRCACGRLAAIVLDGDADGTAWCSVRCTCGAFSVPAADGDRV